jgi:uncharacterized membrane protein
MKDRRYRLLLLLVFGFALQVPAVRAQIVMNVDVTLPPAGSSGIVSASCSADLEEADEFGPFNAGSYFYEGVYLQSCILYTPDNGEPSCSGEGNGGGYVVSSCSFSVETSSSGDYNLDAASAVYNWYDSLALGTGDNGWGTCTDSDYPYDDPLGYAYTGTESCPNTTACGPDTGDGLVWICVDGSPFSDILEIESPTYTFTAPISVSITQTNPTLNEGQTSTFTATVKNGTNSDVTWSLSPATGAGTLSSSGATATYTAPASVTSEIFATVTAKSTQDTAESASDDVTVEPVTFTVTPSSSILVATAGATLPLTASVNGSVDPPTVTWAIGSGGVGAIPASGTSVTYTAPTPAITTPATFNITATDALASPSTAQVSMTLVPPVIVSSVSSPWFAGQATPVTINGSGFGATPIVSLSPNVGTLSPNVNAAGTQITGTITILANVPSGPVVVTVTNPDTAAGALQATGNATVTGATFTAAVTPTGQSLDETQSQQFTDTITCKTGAGGSCSAGSPPIVWSINPGWGSISSSGLYTANVTGIAQNTPVEVMACAAIVAGSASVCSSPDQLTILPITVGNVNAPSAAILAGKTTQFNPPSITNAPNNAQTVYWYVNGIQNGNSSVGTISAGGLYTAPNPVTATNTSVQVTACSSVDTSRCSPTPANVQLADFTVTATPVSQGVTTGSVATYSVNVAAIGLFTGNVALTDAGCPTGASCTFIPATIASFPGTSTLFVTTTATTPDTVDALVITGTTSGTSGTLSRSTTVSLAVGTPDFSLNVSPSQQTVSLGSTTTYTVTVAPVDGFTGAVSLNSSGLPAGATGTFSSTSIPNSSGSSTLTIAAAATMAPGTYTFTITGTSGALTQTQTVSLVVEGQSFSLSVASNNLNIAPGSTGELQTTVYENLGGFTGTVSLNVTGLPGGVSAIFSPGQVSFPVNGLGSVGYVTLTFTVSGSVPPGTYPLTITGSSGTLSQTANLNLVVTASGFNISGEFPPPGSEQVDIGETTGETVTVTPFGGFTGTVALAVNGLPAGVTGAFTPTTITGGSGGSSLALTASSSMTIGGTYPLTITGTSGGVTSTVPYVIDIPNPSFSLALTPPTQALQPGGSATLSAYVNPLTEINESYALAVTGLPAGVTYSFNPASIGGDGGTSSLTLTASASATLNTYTPTITATATNNITDSAQLTLAITQCTYALSPTSGSTSGTVNVTTQAGCPWSAVPEASSPASITVTSGGTGTGSGSFTYSGTGSISVWGQVFTAAACKGIHCLKL